MPDTSNAGQVQTLVVATYLICGSSLGHYWFVSDSFPGFDRLHVGIN